MLEKLIEAYASGQAKAFHLMSFNMTKLQQKHNPVFIDKSFVKTTMYVDKEEMTYRSNISQLPTPANTSQNIAHKTGFYIGYYLPKLFIPGTYSFFPENR